MFMSKTICDLASIVPLNLHSPNNCSLSFSHAGLLAGSQTQDAQFNLKFKKGFELVPSAMNIPSKVSMAHAFLSLRSFLHLFSENFLDNPI